MNKISIIIPVYNSEKYLKKCLDALLSQTFKDIEIICINDGSTDNSIKILNEYSDKDKRLFVFTQKNAGPATARNVGLQNATGQYVMFCDADDWYEPTMCESMLNTILSHNCDLVMCQNYFEFEDNNDISNQMNHRKLNSFYNIPTEGIATLNSKFRSKTNTLLWNKIWKKSLIDKYQISFPNGIEHDDDAFWYMYSFVSNNVFYLQEKFYHYRIHSNSIMDIYFSGKQKNKYDRFKICCFVYNFLKNNNILLNYSDDIFKLFKLQTNLISQFLTISELQEVIEKIKKLFYPVYGDKFLCLIYPPKKSIVFIKSRRDLFKHYCRMIINKIVFLLKKDLKYKDRFLESKYFIELYWKKSQ